MAAPAPKAAPDQRLGSWIFGSLLLAFYLGVFVFGPSVLADYKYRMLGVISALLGGLFAYFLTGQIVSTLKGNLSGAGQLTVRATGGIGLALVLLLWWGQGAGPIQSSSQAAVQLQQKLQEAVSNAPTSSSPPVPSAVANGTKGGRQSPAARPATVALSPAVQQLAKALAASDPKYSAVGVLQEKKEISVGTLKQVNNSLLQAARSQ